MSRNSHTIPQRRSHGGRRWLAALTGAVLLALGMTASAHAAFDIVPGSFSAGTFREDGSPETQAGAHPFAATTTFDTTKNDKGLIDDYFKDLRLKLPPGFVGDPEAAPKCPRADFNELLLSYTPKGCPPASQIGIARVRYRVRTQGPREDPVPVYLLETADGTTAQFGIPFIYSPVSISSTADTAGDYGLVVTGLNTSQGLAVSGVTVTIWGSPQDPAHDSERFCGAKSGLGPDGAPGAPCPVDAPRKPFLTNPTQCAGPQVSTLSLSSWGAPDVFKTATATAPPITGCDRVSFTPEVSVRPDTRTPDAPTGLGVDLDLPQADDPQTGFAPSSLRNVKVSLPDGLTINPGSANGLAACSDAELGLKSNAPIACPEASKIGTATATTPVLPDPLEGSVYLRTQNSSDPGSGEMFRLALVLESKKRGLLVKLPGQVRVDAATGRITTEFDDNPQLPVEKVTLALKSGARAPLATPSACGTFTTSAALSSWSGMSVDRQSAFGVDCTAGLGGFAPSLTAGAVQPVGGAFSAFGLSMSKPDGNADVNGLSLVLPTGLLASLKGNVGTQVGMVKAYAGPGAQPFVLPGQVYLEGAYGDAPFSLKVVVPAKAGPFDLGEVVVRQKIYVDPIDAHVTVVSDPLPTIVSGVPVRLQRLDVSVDKPGFMVNPTSCAAKAVGGTLNAAGGQTAPVNVRFQVGSCSDLALKPELALSLSGKGQTTDGKHPAVTATLTQKPGQANLKKVRVTLPLSLALDTENANGLCEFVDGTKTTPTCPRNSIVGTATATTPILDEPLSGPVYFVKDVRNDPKSGRPIKTTPKLVIPLVGQNGVKLTLTGRSTVDDDRLVTTFDNVPDAPVSSFKLSIIGGKGGILVVSGDKADICKSTQVADQQIDGQNNKAADADVFIQTPSCPLKVLSKKVGKASVAVKVGGLGAGKVTVSGKGIKKATKTIAKSTVATITAKRTKGKPGKVTVSYDPAGPAKARKTTK